MNSTRQVRWCIAVGLLVASAFLSLSSASAWAHGSKHKDAETSEMLVFEQKDWGIAATADKAQRTIEVSMSDDMRFDPEKLDVALGETIRFVIHNEGEVLHEYVIGTTENTDEHARLMMKFPGMEHDEPHMAHVAPGESAEIVWTFNKPGKFDFACLIAGHYQAGMVGNIAVSPS